MADDKIQREIEDILSRLDDFVPEEGVSSRMRRRSSGAASAFARMLEPFAHVSLPQVMLVALALIVVGFIASRATPVGTWMLIGGIILFLTTFALSFFQRGSPSTARGPEKRWRGRPMEIEGPTLRERIRSWLNAKRRPRY